MFIDVFFVCDVVLLFVVGIVKGFVVYEGVVKVWVDCELFFMVSEIFFMEGVLCGGDC